MTDLIVILGPTAVGKTKLAVQLAHQLDGEVLSADSRQVYKGMDVGTGKDLADFTVNGKTIPHHLIDIKEAGEEYHVFDFQRDFYAAYQTILKRKKLPVLCGGTGLYLEAALAKERMIEVPENKELRMSLAGCSQEELVEQLKSLTSQLHNTTDVKDRSRTIRAIEIARFKQGTQAQPSPVNSYCLFGIRMERQALRTRIEERLKDRLEQGMLNEVSALLESGLSPSQLYYYGLEYRFITAYLLKELSYEQMYRQLLQAIRRFSKKQMTWYRRMEKQGYQIHWLEAESSLEEKVFEVNRVRTNSAFAN